MADISRHASDMASHPDAAELRERYARVADGPRMVVIDGLVLLAGLYAAISPWVVHFHATSPDLAASDLVVGLGLAAIGLGLILAPRRAFALCWVSAVLGVWLIISPWVATVGNTATRDIIWNNAVTGAAALVLGAAAVTMLLTGARRAAR